MAELLDISEGYKYQHNATKTHWKSNLRNPQKYKVRDTFSTDRVYEINRAKTNDNNTQFTTSPWLLDF